MAENEQEVTLREHFELSERVTRLETELKEVANLQRKALWAILSAVLIAVLKGVNVI